MIKKKYTILFVVEAMGGGVFTYMVELANELSNDYTIYIAYATRKQTPKNYEEYFDKRIKLIKVENFERSINPIKDVKAFMEVKKIAKKINPDIIHLHSSKAGVIGRWAFNGKKIPVFYTPHGYSFLMKNHGLLKRGIYRFIEVVCGLRNCTTISCSKGEHIETKKLVKNAEYVNNGIDMEELDKILDSLNVNLEHEFTVFTLGRICYQKNPKLFNEIALLMPNIRFVWIGDGELRDELIAPNIVITGWVNREEALRQSLSGDVFILTSLWEGLPISLLEAMYMRKICVVSDVIGNRDVIKTSRNGFVCKDLNEFVKAIKIIQEEDMEGLVNEAYTDILREYNTKSMAKGYDKIYKDKLLNKKR